MATVKFEYGRWSGFWGYTCGQCYTTYPTMEGALRHEEKIDNNNGICPDA